jgi:hypothetical protein
MKKQAVIPIIVLLFLAATLTLIPQNTHVATATTEPSTLSSTIWSEFPPIEPYYEIFNPPLNGTYFIVYHTTFGDYYFDQYEGTYKFYYRNGEAFASAVRGILWYWDGADWQDLNYSNIAFSYTNNSLSFTRDVMYGSVKVGNHTTTVKFYKELKPKISFAFAESPAWNSEGLTDFKWVFKVTLPAKFQWFYDEDTGFSYNITTTQTFTKKKAEFIDAPNKTTWHYGLLVDWTDYGNASLKIEKGSTISVVFDANVLNIDPSVVGTSIVDTATFYAFQRKSFYANGRFWVFYSNGGDIVYRTSTDGSTWSSATTVRTCGNGYDFSVWFDGTYLHYAFAYQSSIYYRRGTPNANGTITWSASEQTVSTTYNQAYFPMVSVDSNGYVWIGYRDNYYPYVIKSGNNDGTWGTTPSGFPYQLSTQGDYSWKVSVIPLTSGKMLAVYAYDYQLLFARRWDGSAWGTEATTASWINYAYAYSAVAQGDDVHLTFLKYSTKDILYVRYTYSSNSFGSETTLQAGATSSSAPVISIDTATNDLYVFWAGNPTANHIYYRKYNGTTWEDTVDWITETALTGNDRLTCFYKAYGSQIGLEYMTGTASPYNVTFAFLPPQKLNLRIKDTNGNTINGATALVSQISGLSDSYGWVNFTLIQNSKVSVSVKYQDVWVNGTFTVTMDSDKTIDVVCNVYSLTIHAVDANGNSLANASLTLFRDTTELNGLYGLPSSPQTNATGHFVWNQLANTSYTIKTYYQDVLINQTSLALNNNEIIEISCNVYSLTVKVQTATGDAIPDCPLELYRDSTLLNGLYGLPLYPKTNSSGMFTWQQLANQTASYTIKSPWAGFPDTTTNLTENTLITITIAAAPPPTPPTPTPTPTPTPIPTPEQIIEQFKKIPLLIFVPIGIMIAVYAVIARKRKK